MEKTATEEKIGSRQL